MASGKIDSNTISLSLSLLNITRPFRDLEKESGEFMHKIPRELRDRSPGATGSATLDRDKEPYRGSPSTHQSVYTWYYKHRHRWWSTGYARVSQSQYLGQGQKVPRSPPLPLSPPARPPRH